MDINGIIRHPREGGDPVINKPIDSSLRGNDVHGVIEHLHQTTIITQKLMNNFKGSINVTGKIR